MNKLESTVTRFSEHYRIDLREKDRVDYWTKKFGCTSKQLRAAISIAGPIAAHVEVQLRRWRANGAIDRVG